MVSLPELRDAQIDPLDAAATAYDTLANNFKKHADDLNTQVLKHVFDGRWVGNAAGAANTAMETTSTRLDAAHTELSCVSGLLREASESFRLAQSKLQEALADAKTDGFTVADDGTVTWPPPSAAERHDPDYDTPQRGKAIADRISHAVSEAANADQKISKALDGLTQRAKTGAGLSLDNAAADQKNVTQLGTDLLNAGFPPQGAGATEVNSWWKGLTPDEQQRLIQAHPDLLGNRDGIPAAARNQANLLNLDHLTKEYENKPNPSDADKQKLEGFRAIRTKLDQAKTKEPPPVFLLAVSDEGQGRGCLSWGNPDTAKNVSAYVPGLGTKLSDVGGKDADRARNVWQAAHNADPTAETASMVWLGYDPPPGPLDGDPRTLEVMSGDRAQKGGANYDTFMGGLRATHEGAPAHLVALGHSYGSTTVGMAATQGGGTGADDIILVGSPGTGADRASQLHIDPKHVWVGDAQNDPVSHLPAKERVAADGTGAAIGAKLMGPLGAWTGGKVANELYDDFGDTNDLWFGKDPAAKDFGANRFAVADGAPLSFDSHSNYMEDPNMDTSKDPAKRDELESINNIGQIVAGKYDNVTKQDGR
ncbi:alpha/beta hydrolase [Kitasatospora sp. NPDC094011]|uniref:alpha/beta hydrolase n=1 Tax=Kitasatospora sp. NPDC094011 TaxID=3364090 RepID=UPI0037F48288